MLYFSKIKLFTIYITIILLSLFAFLNFIDDKDNLIIICYQLIKESYLVIINNVISSGIISTCITFLSAFFGHQVLTGTIRHVFYVQIGNATIPPKTRAIRGATIEISQAY